MQVHNKNEYKHVILESEIVESIDHTLPVDQQLTQFHEKTAIQKKLIAEQAMQIYWLIAELRGRDAEIAA